MRKIISLSTTLLLLLLSTGAFSQLGGVHNYLDTAYIATRNTSQQQEFLKNSSEKKDSLKSNSAFPAKPRDMWQLSVFAGVPWVDGDCALAVKGAGSGISNYAFGGGIGVRKAIGYVLSLRGSVAYYNMLGLDYQRNRNYNNHPFIEQMYNIANPRGYIHSFHTKAIVPSLEALVSLNNIMFHSKQSRWNLYMMGGYTAFMYNTKLDVIDGNGSRYLFETIGITGETRPTIRKELRTMMDGVFETDALTHNRRPDIGDFNLRHSISTGAGLEFRVSKKASVGLEYKRIMTRDDYVDGWFRQSGDLVNPVFTSEWDNIGFMHASVNFNLGNSKTHIPPLWWMNPLQYAYGELSNSTRIIYNVHLNDDDGDGVINQFDWEPNTPTGSPVDSHGVSEDTDGDGVIDFRDKEKITLANCFPVDEDGVGSCPEPECCAEIRKMKTGVITPGNDCKINDLPSVQLIGTSVRLSRDAQAILSNVASQLKANPGCNVKVSGHGRADKHAQQLSWDRVNAVILYLVEKQGIADNRVIFEYGTEGDPNTIDLMGTTEETPNRVAAPHPNLRRTN